MFEWLRRMIMPIIIIALLTFVGMIVLQWGLDITRRGQGGPTGNYAGKINGEEISWTTFNNAYQDLYRQAAQNTDEELPEEQVEQLNQQAWNNILQEKLLMQEADRLGVTVSDEEIYAYLRYNPPTYLQAIPQFQTNGQFDYQKYFQALRDESAAPFWNAVQPQVIADIKKYKVQQSVVQTAYVSEDEIRQEYIDNDEKVDVKMINVAIDQYNKTELEVSDEDALEYYNTHKDKFAVNERTTIAFVQESKEPSDADWERSRAQIQVVYDSLMNGADFEDMARLFSQDISAEQGGDLGWFAEGRMVKPFNDRAFSMKEGEISEPFQTQFGWHIIKHYGYRTERMVPPGSKEEQDVKEAHCAHILIKTEASSDTRTAAYDKMANFQTAAQNSGFDEAAEAKGLEVISCRPFDRRGPVQYLGRDQELIDFAFDAKPGTISDVREGPNSYYVVHVIERLPAGTAPFEDVKSQVVVDLRNSRYLQMDRDTAQAIYDMIQAGTSFDDAAKAKGVRLVDLEPFTRNGFVRGIGRAPAAIGVAFSLKTPGEVSKPVDHRNGTVLFQLQSRTSPDLTRFTQVKDSLSTQALNQKQQQLYSRWFQDLVDNSDIENNVDALRNQTNQS